MTRYQITARSDRNSGFSPYDKSVGGDVKKSITSSFFNRIPFHLAVRCRTFQKIYVKSLKLKFQTVAEKTAKNFRGLLYFAAPGR